MGKKPSLGIQTKKYDAFLINDLKFTFTKKVRVFSLLIYS